MSENKLSHLKRITVLVAIVVSFPLPVLAQWTQGAPGRVWVKSAFLRQRTERRFDQFARDTIFLPPSEADSRAIFTDVIVGLHPKVDLWLQFPFFDLRFKQPADTLQTVGFGDIRAWVRWNVINIGGSTPVALRVGAKFPVGSSPLDAQVIPVGDGQWDIETWGEIGHSFWPFPAYAELWVGYRARLENTESLKDPGGEYTLLSEIGVNPTSSTLLKVTLDGFWGKNWIIEGLEIATAKRRILTLQLAAGFRAVGPLWTEVGARLPLSGRNFPNGTQFLFALSSQLR